MSSSSRKQIIATFVTIVFLVIVFAGILPKFGDYEVAFEEIKSMNTSDIILLSVFTLANILIYVFPYMAAVPRLRYMPAFVLRQTSFLISNAVPGGGALGLGMQYAMLASYGYSGAIASSAILLTSTWNLLATISLPGFAALGLLVVGQLDKDSAFAALIGIGVAALALGAYILIFKSESLARKIGNWSDRTIKKLASFINKKVETSITKSVMEFRSEAYEATIKRWHWLAGSNYLQQIAQFSVLYVALQILEPGSATFVAVFAAFAVARLGSFIPLTPGGLGTVDALLVGFLVQAGVTNDSALAATLIWRFATFIPQIIIGILTFLYWRVKGKNLNKNPA